MADAAVRTTPHSRREAPSFVSASARRLRALQNLTQLLQQRYCLPSALPSRADYELAHRFRVVATSWLVFSQRPLETAVATPVKVWFMLSVVLVPCGSGESAMFEESP